MNGAPTLSDQSQPDGLTPGVAPRRPRPLRSVIVAVLATVLLGAGGLALGARIGAAMKAKAHGGGVGLSGGQELLLAVLCGSALFVVLLAHELGHLFGGRVVGFRALLLIVGPFRLERDARQWRLRLNRSVALAGGLAASVPLDSHDIARRSAVMVAGGPATSLILGAAALGAWLLDDPGAITGGAGYERMLLAFVLMTFGASSLAIGVATLIPMTTSGYLSDGARLLRLWRGGAVAERDGAMQSLIGLSLGGTRPRDLPPALISRATTLKDGSMFELVAWQFAQMRAADAGERAEAERLLDRIVQNVERLPPTARPSVQYDAVRQLATVGRLSEARALFGQVHGAVLGAPYIQPLAEAALLVGEGEHARARPLLDEAEQALGSALDRGGSLWLLECVASLRLAETRVGGGGEGEILHAHTA